MAPSLRTALDHLRQSPSAVAVIRDAGLLAEAAAHDGGRAGVTLLLEAVLADDELIAVAAVHALGEIFDDEADAALAGLLLHPRAFLREHAAWVLGGRLPRLAAIEPLRDMVVGGGFPAMLAQRTLETWSGPAGDHIAAALESALTGQEDPDVRRRIVETLGLAGGPAAGETLRLIATDKSETARVRGTAVAALGDRLGDRAAADVIESLWGSTGGDLGGLVRLAAVDLGLVEAGAPALRTSGLTVAQLFLHADLDPQLSQAGAGDNGGIATLLVRLGDALADQPGVDRVLTMSRGTPAAALATLSPGGSHVLGAVPVPAVPATQAWPSRVAARRGIRRLLRAHRVDVLHLRMADVGSLAAAEAAAGLGIPTVFTLAPDPHAAIDALDRSGELRRDDFGRHDEREHYWFRARLVQRLTAAATHVALFPRPWLSRDLRDLVGIDVTRVSTRYSVVPEGIDLQVSLAAAAAPPAADLATLIATLPPERRHLPLALSVGRLHRVKGMAAVVRAWAQDPSLTARCNLVIVGGDLRNPSPDEREQLDLIDAVLREYPAARAGLLLPGHRPHDVVARWLAVAAADHGIYVCGSLKEEFGLALLEALAAGLVVIGPASGGPATYIEPGVTGFLVEPGALATAFRPALDLAAREPGARVDRARDRIRDGLTVQSMAAALADVYTAVTSAAAQS